MHRSSEDAIAIDGKTLKGSRSQGRKPTYLLSAFLQQQKVAIAQQAIDVKSNEITAAVPMLEDVNIEGMVVTADALHAQQEFTKFIIEEKRAEYLFTIKDNQPTLKNDIESLHLEAFPPST